VIITPKNWAAFQHYKDRAPAWIKLHRGLLDDFEFSRLPVASRALAPLLWLLASEYEGGGITASTEELAFRLRMPENELRTALTPLIDGGFFNASEPLADCKQEAIPEERRERDREEKIPRVPALVFESDWPKDYRDLFWQAFPKRVDKQAAFKKLEQLRKLGKLPWATLIAGVGRYAESVRGTDPQYIKSPAAWLNAGKWDDEILVKTKPVFDIRAHLV
jgi:hypothetical protein